MKKKRGDEGDGNNTENKKLDLKKEEYEKKISNRLDTIDNITGQYPDMKEMRDINDKFHVAYSKRVDFGQAMMKARENCGELKKKVERF